MDTDRCAFYATRRGATRAADDCADGVADLRAPRVTRRATFTEVRVFCERGSRSVQMLRWRGWLSCYGFEGRPELVAAWRPRLRLRLRR